MVDIAKKIIKIQGREYKIVAWETWWAVEGLGLFSSLGEVSLEVPPESINLLNVRPVAVAVTDMPGVYETF